MLDFIPWPIPKTTQLRNNSLSGDSGLKEKLLPHKGFGVLTLHARPDAGKAFESLKLTIDFFFKI
jgi:hypothetical protein